MKKYLVLLSVLLLPSLVLGVTLEPGETFVCDGNNYTCEIQECPTCECSYENCSQYINTEINKTLNTCLKTYEKIKSFNEFNFSQLNEELLKCQNERENLKVNITTLEKEKITYQNLVKECEKQKNDLEQNRIFYGLVGFGAALIIVYMFQPEFLLKKGETTTGTEGGYEPTEGM